MTQPAGSELPIEQRHREAANKLWAACIRGEPEGHDVLAEAFAQFERDHLAHPTAVESGLVEAATEARHSLHALRLGRRVDITAAIERLDAALQSLRNEGVDSHGEG